MVTYCVYWKEYAPSRRTAQFRKVTKKFPLPLSVLAVGEDPGAVRDFAKQVNKERRKVLRTAKRKLKAVHQVRAAPAFQAYQRQIIADLQKDVEEIDNKVLQQVRNSR
jgi:hypothetical protein